MDRMTVESIKLLVLMTDLLNRQLQAMVWLGRQPEKFEIDVPVHLEQTLRQGHRDGSPCVLIARERTDDDALFEVLRLVLGAMGPQKPVPRRAATKPSSRKRP